MGLSLVPVSLLMLQLRELSYHLSSQTLKHLLTRWPQIQYAMKNVPKDVNGEFLVGEHLPIPVPMGEKTPHPRPH